ncbi:MAG: YbaB/EbfC family nucleoid-associated protein [Actinophytocola sp.]|uniref:YbaB/EbfC family nucleoid-associated protein n=1 Tax=Actinophytocola sp. TaxID=1872138 RepID=UPI003C722869
MTDPHAIVDDLDRRTQELLQRAEQTKSDIAKVTGVATSEDGVATATVSATGALLAVSFGRAADKLPKERLAEAVMAAARKAQATAARQVTDLMTPLIGNDSDAMRMLREQLPKLEEPSPAQQKHRPVAVYNEERENPRQPPRPPRSAPAADDHDYDQRTVLKKGRR